MVPWLFPSVLQWIIVFDAMLRAVDGFGSGRCSSWFRQEQHLPKFKIERQ